MKNKKNVTLILSILMLITISFSGCAYVGSEVNELNGSITGNGKALYIHQATFQIFDKNMLK